MYLSFCIFVNIFIFKMQNDMKQSLFSELDINDLNSSDLDQYKVFENSL